MGNCVRGGSVKQEPSRSSSAPERSRRSSLGFGEVPTPSVECFSVGSQYRMDEEKAAAAWAKNGGEELEPAVSSGAVAMLSSQWLVRLADAGGILAPRQGLDPGERRLEQFGDVLFPKHSKQDRKAVTTVIGQLQLDRAFVSLENLVAEVHETVLRVFCVSHCWLQHDHPDPRGHNLRVIGRCLKLLSTDSFNGYAGHWGVFVDFCSLHQGCRDSKDKVQPHVFEWLDSEMRFAQNAIGRRAAEDVLFRQALTHLGSFYTHPCTFVAMVSGFPPDYDDLTVYNRHRRCENYFNRGWCFCEALWATLTKDHTLVLDLGKDTGKKKGFFGLKAQCHGDRRPPVLPEVFSEELQKKWFSHAVTDRPRVEELYANAFSDRFTHNTKLDYVRLAWANREARAVAAVLRAGAVPHLRELLLGMNRIGDSGTACLAEAIGSGATPRLSRLSLGINRVGDAGLESLAVAFGSGATPVLAQLWLQNNQIADAGVLALAEALPQIPSLTDLGLGGNAAIKAPAKEVLRKAWGSRISGGYGLDV